jgi:uncharacterized protein
MNLFLMTFFLLYGGTHLYFFLKMKAALDFGWIFGGFLALFLTAMVAAPVLVRLMEQQGMERSARMTAYCGYLWMGFLFLFSSAALTVDLWHGLLYVGEFLSRGDFPRMFLSRRAAFVVPLLWGGGAALYGYFEAQDIRLERVVITSSKIPRSPGMLTLVQLSDVHLGLINRKERLKKVLDRVREARPDILVVTGDLVDGQINGLTGLAPLLNEIRPPLGKFAVTGNHELYAGLDHSVAFMRDAGLRVLRGEGVTVAGVPVAIAGVDDPVTYRISGTAPEDEQRILAGLPGDRFTVLLKHRPAVSRQSDGLFDLQLSGHVHKGQIFPFNLVTWLFYPVKTGLSRTKDGGLLYVSRGTGTWGPPIRFLAPPEVTVFELRHGEKP